MTAANMRDLRLVNAAVDGAYSAAVHIREMRSEVVFQGIGPQDATWLWSC
jgi:hypothetical protein